jgi:hypothetical protein
VGREGGMRGKGGRNEGKRKRRGNEKEWEGGELKLALVKILHD